MVKRAKTEGQVWEIISRDRKRRKEIEEGIKMKKWEEYFKWQLAIGQWRSRMENSIRIARREERGERG